ncbi:MAG: pyridoxal phosphate-dependent aminotransferase [Bacteroidales bacterium]|nr:pyridoxal phosphate-dependent aminotransferase [Bacteroidales bacterium]MBR5832782.1 pyridoxal phosphate-dependent aminotransferase [Bacteroidales bacterium]
MTQIPITKETIDRIAQSNKIANPGKASIREMRKMIQDVEAETGIRFVKMEMGIPGLPAAQVGVEAEIEALRNGVASIYPEIYGTQDVKDQISLFVKNFLDIDVPTDCCVPTVGSMQAGFASFLTLTRYDKNKTKVLFIDPGFPVQKQQCRVLGIEYKTFDVYDYRGEKLRGKLEEMLKDGDVACIIYSSPNNPAWFCFTDEELKIIGEMANKYGVIILEDLAYFAMDFRKDYSQPGVAPFQPTVAKYTNNYVLMISGSKSFSYAGQRIAMMVISPELFGKECPDLARYYSQTQLGRAMIFGTLYCLSSGTAHSAQYALAAMLKGANDGTYNFVKDIHEYGEKAHIMKKMFIDNGFYIVYDEDMGEPIGDGFYFTFCYPGYTGVDLLNELIRYGISAISLDITGSTRQGIRACVALVLRDQFPDLEARLVQFHKDHPIK